VRASVHPRPVRRALNEGILQQQRGPCCVIRGPTTPVQAALRSV
jgi:hypothetical protein